MATQNITITTATGANPDNPSVHRASANGDNAIKFQSGSGTHTITNLPTGVFSPEPPATITVSPGNPSGVFTVLTGATDGEYAYSVDGGGTLAGDGKKPKIKIEP